MKREITIAGLVLFLMLCISYLVYSINKTKDTAVTTPKNTTIIAPIVAPVKEKIYKQADRISAEAVIMFDAEQDVVSFTNYRRIAASVYPLRIDSQLMATARTHAAWMARTGNMRHGRLGNAFAENIAAGQTTPQEAVTTWFNSSGHNANMMNTRFTKLGVGCYVGGDGKTYWCQQFK